MILFRHTTPTLLFTILFAAFGAQAALKSDNFVLLDHNGSAQELYYQADASAIVLNVARRFTVSLTSSLNQRSLRIP